MARDSIPTVLAARLQPFFGSRRPAAWRRPHGGYTPAERWLVTLGDGSSCFVKTGAGVWAARLRVEHEVYSRLQADFLPRQLGWDDDGVAPLLVLEDLSDAFWPPPWTTAAQSAEGSTEAKEQSVKSGTSSSKPRTLRSTPVPSGPWQLAQACW